MVGESCVMLVTSGERAPLLKVTAESDVSHVIDAAAVDLLAPPRWCGEHSDKVKKANHNVMRRWSAPALCNDEDVPHELSKFPSALCKCGAKKRTCSQNSAAAQRLARHESPES
jgi:hypothetical protein